MYSQEKELKNYGRESHAVKGGSAISERSSGGGTGQQHESYVVGHASTSGGEHNVHLDATQMAAPDTLYMQSDLSYAERLQANKERR